MRVKQQNGLRGSRKWIQKVIECHPQLIDKPLRLALGIGGGSRINWHSPRQADDWAEYRDDRFLAQVNLAHLRDALAAFWPTGGPQWDALATCDQKVLLCEAKSHVSELKSTCAASSRSRVQIERSLARARSYFGARSRTDWMAEFYQYANRLAHLYFLRTHGIDAHLVFVYFTNDPDMRGPESPAEWQEALQAVHTALGLQHCWPVEGVRDVFIDVRSLASRAESA